MPRLERQKLCRTVLPGECDYPEVWLDPLPDVVSVLRRFSDWREVLENLPDRPPQAIAPFSF